MGVKHVSARFIAEQGKGISTISLLRKGKMKTRKSGRLKQSREHKNLKCVLNSISERPPEADDRSETGHWEMDCILGLKSDRGAILSLTGRKMRDQILVFLPRRHSYEVCRGLDSLARRYGSRGFRRMFKRGDNGSEFANLEGMERSVITKRKELDLLRPSVFVLGKRE